MRETLKDIEKVKSVRENRKADGYPIEPLLSQEISTDRYISASYFEEEKSRVFRRTWQIAGRVSQVGESGMYFVHHLPGYSLLFTRDKFGVIRGFLNACRHRGCELAVDSGKTGRFVCRYHAWTYDLTGRLIGVPEQQMFPGLDKSQRGLTPISVAEWAGFLWFNIEDCETPLTDYLGELWDHKDGFPWETYTHLASQSKEVDCNWKLAIDNFNEVYHLPYVHPNTGGPKVDWRNEIVEPLGLHSRFFHGFSFETDRVRAAGAPTAAQRTFDALDPAAKELQYTYQIFPNAFLFPAAEHLIMLRVHPLAVDRCRMDFDHFGPLPENEDEEKTLKDRLDFYNLVSAEDFILLPDMQRGLQSGGNTTMPLGYLELAVFNFNRSLDRFMQAKS